MRIARVIGQVTLNRAHPDLVKARWLIVQPANRGKLAGFDGGNVDSIIAYDDLGARIGDDIALAEGREAASPFEPKRVPVDAYDAAILEQVTFNPIAPVKK